MAVTQERDPQSNPKYTLQLFPSGNKPSDAILADYTKSNVTMRENKAKYGALWTEHITKSRQFIKDSMQGHSSRALVLGLGNATDIPLSEMVDQFDEVTVVDIDEQTAVRTVSALSPTQQSKVDIVIDDLAGVNVSLMQRAQEIVESGQGYISVVTQLIDAMRNIQRKPYTPSQQYSFISSSLVVSQLVSQSVEYINNLLAGRLGHSLQRAPFTLADKVNIALTDLSIATTQDHMHIMSQALEPDGNIYLSDSVAEIYTRYEPRLQGLVPITNPMYMWNPEMIRSIDPYFKVEEERSWNWHRFPPGTKGAGSPGSTLQIIGMKLS